MAKVIPHSVLLSLASISQPTLSATVHSPAQSYIPPKTHSTASPQSSQHTPPPISIRPHNCLHNQKTARIMGSADTLPAISFDSSVNHQTTESLSSSDADLRRYLQDTCKHPTPSTPNPQGQLAPHSTLDRQLGLDRNPSMTLSTGLNLNHPPYQSPSGSHSHISGPREQSNPNGLGGSAFRHPDTKALTTEPTVIISEHAAGPGGYTGHKNVRNSSGLDCDATVRVNDIWSSASGSMAFPMGDGHGIGTFGDLHEIVPSLDLPNGDSGNEHKFDGQDSFDASEFLNVPELKDATSTAQDSNDYVDSGSSTGRSNAPELETGFSEYSYTANSPLVQDHGFPNVGQIAQVDQLFNTAHQSPVAHTQSSAPHPGRLATPVLPHQHHGAPGNAVFTYHLPSGHLSPVPLSHSPIPPTSPHRPQQPIQVYYQSPRTPHQQGQHENPDIHLPSARPPPSLFVDTSGAYHQSAFSTNQPMVSAYSATPPPLSTSSGESTTFHSTVEQWQQTLPLNYAYYLPQQSHVDDTTNYGNSHTSLAIQAQGGPQYNDAYSVQGLSNSSASSASYESSREKLKHLMELRKYNDEQARLALAHSQEQVQVVQDQSDQPVYSHTGIVDMRPSSGLSIRSFSEAQKFVSPAELSTTVPIPDVELGLAGARGTAVFVPNGEMLYSESPSGCTDPLSLVEDGTTGRQKGRGRGGARGGGITRGRGASRRGPSVGKSGLSVSNSDATRHNDQPPPSSFTAGTDLSNPGSPVIKPGYQVEGSPDGHQGKQSKRRRLVNERDGQGGPSQTGNPNGVSSNFLKAEDADKKDGIFRGDELSLVGDSSENSFGPSPSLRRRSSKSLNQPTSSPSLSSDSPLDSEFHLSEEDENGGGSDAEEDDDFDPRRSSALRAKMRSLGRQGKARDRADRGEIEDGGQAQYSHTRGEQGGMSGAPGDGYGRRKGKRGRRHNVLSVPDFVEGLNKKSRGRKVPNVRDALQQSEAGIDDAYTAAHGAGASGPGATSRMRMRRSSRSGNAVAGTSTGGPGIEDRTYICQACGKGFVRGEHLKRHVRSIHTNEKPHKCDLCGKEFSRRDNLNQHRRVHEA